MNDEQALLAAILTEPDEDTPRLVYADWLQEYGNENRAQFIRLQVALANWSASELCVQSRKPYYKRRPGRQCSIFSRNPDHNCWCRRDAIQAQSDALVATHGDEWVPRVSAMWDWHRGFVRGVTCTVGDWLASGDELAAAHPVNRVTFMNMIRNPDLTRLCRMYEDRCDVGAAGKHFGSMLCEMWPRVTFELKSQLDLMVEAFNASAKQMTQAIAPVVAEFAANYYAAVVAAQQQLQQPPSAPLPPSE